MCRVIQVMSIARRCNSTLKPGWKLPKEKHRWGPEIPDSYYYWEHPIYTGYSLWIRALRPYLEKLFHDTYKTVHFIIFDCFWIPFQNFFHKHNPDIRLKLISIASFYATSHAINMVHNLAYQNLVDLRRCRSLELAQELEKEGFWDSQEEDIDQRISNYLDDKKRLETLWETALLCASTAPTASEGFKCLCSYLEKPIEKTTLPVPMTWRFDMIPYGSNNPHTKTFPIPPHEQPHRAFAFNLVYNNLISDWGDYIHRLDNKQALLRPSRILFTDVYIPPTK